MAKKVLTILIGLMIGQSAFAVGGYAGGGLGYAKVDFPSLDDSSVSISGRVGAIFNDQFAIGLGFISYSKTEGSASFSIVPVMLEANFHIISGANGPYVGAAVGTVTETLEVGTVSVSESESAMGIQVGYNFPLNGPHSLGGELKYIKVKGDPDEYSFSGLTCMYNYWW